MEPIAKKWYDHLAEGKIMATKCKDCGAYTFPPLTVCRECRSRNLEWVEISGEAQLIMFSSTILPAKKFASLAPISYGLVKLKEGPCFFTKIEGVKCSNAEEIRKENESLPAPVRAEIKNVLGMNIVVFRK
ncbi:MAG: zinc ribbon domain-containing protein [Candidatus Paceibacterota bacterium]|nr:zinc ribbon domain-containing protein [Candidatus Paceibacterota bacterium]